MKIHHYLYFFIPMVLASCIYAVANFKESTNKKSTLKDILIISLFFASIEYLLKVPAIHFIKGKISPLTIQLVWIFATFYIC